jgi:putative ABC transport system ATP-binding protein
MNTTGTQCVPAARRAGADRIGRDLVIGVRDVHKSYGQGAARVTALRGVSMELCQGELVALQGPSGSGKSTLLNLCGLLSEPEQGRVQLDGADATGWSMRERTLARRQKIGFIFQSFNLVPVMSVFENIEYPLLLSGVAPAQRRAQVERMLARLGIEPLGRRRPDEISGGQRQRVAIGRALIKRPRLVIADEPTANLDSATATQIIDLMHEAVERDQATFLIATHDPAMAARCTRVVRIHDGLLVTGDAAIAAAPEACEAERAPRVARVDAAAGASR